MPIVVQYGPIAGALQAAQMAGTGQGYNIQAQRDMQALQLQNSMQSEIDRNNATQVQQALAYQQLSQQQQAQQQQQSQQAAYQNAQVQLQQQYQQQSAQYQGANQDLAQQRLDQQSEEFGQEQQTRQQQADTIQKLREAQANKINNPPPNNSGAIRANGAALKSMDLEAAQAQNQMKQLTAALIKAQDPYTGNPQDVATIQGQINGIKYSLDGIDPATGKKSGQGLNDQRKALRSKLESFGGNLDPNATMVPDGEGGYDITSPNAGIDQSDPLYQINNPTPAASPANAQEQPGATQQGGGRPLLPGEATKIGMQIASQLGKPLKDPAVVAATSKYLQSQGLFVPPIQ